MKNNPLILGKESANSFYRLRTDTYNRAYFEVRAISGSAIGVVSNDPIDNKHWHHIVGVRQGSLLKLYYDGILENVTNAPSLGSLDNTGPLTIGSSTLTNTQYFTGNIDDVLIYNRALTDDEIQQLYCFSAGLYDSAVSTFTPQTAATRQRRSAPVYVAPVKPSHHYDTLKFCNTVLTLPGNDSLTKAGTLLIKNSTITITGSSRYGNLVLDSSILILNYPITIDGDVALFHHSAITHDSPTDSLAGAVSIQAAGAIIIDSTSAISADGKGDMDASSDSSTAISNIFKPDSYGIPDSAGVPGGGIISLKARSIHISGIISALSLSAQANNRYGGSLRIYADSICGEGMIKIDNSRCAFIVSYLSDRLYNVLSNFADNYQTVLYRSRTTGCKSEPCQNPAVRSSRLRQITPVADHTLSPGSYPNPRKASNVKESILSTPTTNSTEGSR
jgi:hypothetical protein